MGKNGMSFRKERLIMHECPNCGEVCDCDLDDTWGLSVPDDCPHVCGDPDGWFEEDRDLSDAEIEELGAQEAENRESDKVSKITKEIRMVEEPNFDDITIEQVNQYLFDHGYDPESVRADGEILTGALLENIYLKERAEKAEAERTIWKAMAIEAVVALESVEGYDLAGVALPYYKENGIVMRIRAKEKEESEE